MPDWATVCPSEITSAMGCPLTDNNLFQQMAQEIPPKTCGRPEPQGLVHILLGGLNLASNTDLAVL